MKDAAGTGALVRLALRRDRIVLAVWIAVFAFMAAVSALATVDLYPTLTSRLHAAATINGSRPLVALYGRIYDPKSIGAISMIKMGGFGAVFVAMLAVVLVVRHTRADEESGRMELAGSTALGRRAPLTATLTVAVLANLVLAALTAVVLAASGLPVDGSIAFGLAWAGVGIAFAAIAALVAQMTTTARAATSLSAAVLAFVYLLRAIGDAADETGPRWLSWLSPIGWGQRFRPYAGNRWWVLLVTLGFAAVVAAGAFAIAARRDLGTGILPTRPGPPAAGRRFGTAFALTRRLHRILFVGWAVGFTLTGALLGSLASSVADFFTTESSRDFITKLGGEKPLTDAYLAAELGFAAVVAAAYGIQAVGRARSEEVQGRVEPLLATSVPRTRWLLGHVAVAIGGSFALMALAGAGAGVVHAAQTGDANDFWRILAAAVVQLPAAWVLVGIVVLAFGLSPRFVTAGWIALGAFVFLAEIGPLLELGHWVMDLSPFTHTPKLPGVAFTAEPVVILTAIAGALGAAGFVAFRRRDIAS
ncbi:MAG: ABC transporter permease [Acidimicrobiia bacterium]